MKSWQLLAVLVVFSNIYADSDAENTSPKTFEILLKEQRLEASISAYLNYLKEQKKSGTSLPESPIFNEAYLIYLNLQGKATEENAAVIIQKYGSLTDDPNLAYILAASFANLGCFDKFFPLFLTGYRNNPDHYLADKMIAVLHIKLFERLLPGFQKEEERGKILESLQAALAKKKSDHMLYKMMLAFSFEADRAQYVDSLLNTMITEKVVYPRADLLFYVRMAMIVGNRPLAQQFIDYSRGLFGYSRSLEAAQKMLSM